MLYATLARVRRPATGRLNSGVRPQGKNMDFPINEVIGGLVAILLGVLSYLQWKRGKRSGRFIEDREVAYKEVWQSLEGVHLLVRAGDFDHSAFDAMVTKANTLFIRHGLHIADADRALAASYIDALRNLGQKLSLAQILPEAKRSIEITGEHVALSGDLLTAYVEHQSARQQVMDSFRRAIGSGQI